MITSYPLKVFEFSLFDGDPRGPAAARAARRCQRDAAAACRPHGPPSHCDGDGPGTSATRGDPLNFIQQSQMKMITYCAKLGWGNHAEATRDPRSARGDGRGRGHHPKRAGAQRALPVDLGARGPVPCRFSFAFLRAVHCLTRSQYHTMKSAAQKAVVSRLILEGISEC